jgi:large subunit GTPase 1
MGKKESGTLLGRGLLKAKGQTKKGRRVAQQEGYLHTTDMQDGYDWGRLNLQSVTEQDTYTDFMNTAEMAGRDFDAEKWNVKLLDAQTRQVQLLSVK